MPPTSREVGGIFALASVLEIRPSTPAGARLIPVVDRLRKPAEVAANLRVGFGEVSASVVRLDGVEGQSESFGDLAPAEVSNHLSEQLVRVEPRC